MHIYESLVSENMLYAFRRQQGKTLMNLAFNTVDIESMLAASSVYWPTIIQDEGHVFIAEFYTPGLEPLKKQFDNDKQRIERFVNAWSLAEFFLTEAYTPSVESDEILTTFGEVLRFFWSLRLSTLFPNRHFVVEVGEEIEGESGLAITFYEEV
jgi:hypothetical protein